MKTADELIELNRRLLAQAAEARSTAKESELVAAQTRIKASLQRERAAEQRSGAKDFFARAAGQRG